MPILFFFYNALLLEVANQLDLLMILLGFANDINLLIYREAIVVNYTNLELAYD